MEEELRWSTGWLQSKDVSQEKRNEEIGRVYTAIAKMIGDKKFGANSAALLDAVKKLSTDIYESDNVEDIYWEILGAYANNKGYKQMANVIHLMGVHRPENLLLIVQLISPPYSQYREKVVALQIRVGNLILGSLLGYFQIINHLSVYDNRVSSIPILAEMLSNFVTRGNVTTLSSEHNKFITLLNHSIKNCDNGFTKKILITAQTYITTLLDNDKSLANNSENLSHTLLNQINYACFGFLNERERACVLRDYYKNKIHEAHLRN